METFAKTRKIGGSLVVTIPKAIVEKEAISENQTVILNIKKQKVSGFGLLKGIGSFSKEYKFKGQLEKDE